MTDKAKLYAVKNDEGEWLSLDGTKMGIWYSNNPTLFKDKSYAEAQSMGRRAHVVELVESPDKVVVSEEEAEMLERAKDSCWPAHIFDCGAAGAPINSQDRLMRAYVNGWAVEKHKRWNVKVPHTADELYWKRGNGNIGCTGAWRTDDEIVRNLTFTDAEIDHYGLQDCEKVEVQDED
ncbi:DUF1642 domain-containing protein [Lacticaseibacillus mingshuiensis]|uniref:DUF1642 domain-containing protein n=1 Tax=Lacticaseibacillus mingshuiensis TaxID=2799574 RepID=A0ABW4CIC0_9LACO|nr:DUF1642 domain-containing protein [Lacticaseibacillus mingshuiensis]